MSSWFASCPKDHFQSKSEVQFGVPSTRGSLLAGVFFQNWPEGHRVEMILASLLCASLSPWITVFSRRKRVAGRRDGKWKLADPFWSVSSSWEKDEEGSLISKGVSISRKMKHIMTSERYWGSKQQARSLLDVWAVGQFAIVKLKARPPKDGAR